MKKENEIFPIPNAGWGFPTTIEAAMGCQIFRCPRFVAVKTPYTMALFEMLKDANEVNDFVFLKGGSVGFTAAPIYPEIGYIDIGPPFHEGKWEDKAQ